MKLKNLDESETEVVRKCLACVASGKVILHDWEFQLRIGVYPAAFMAIYKSWPDLNESDETVHMVINNVMNNLLGSSHGKHHRWEEFMDVPLQRISEVFEKWRLAPSDTNVKPAAMKTVKTIRNCTVRIKQPCPRNWIDLDHTDDDAVRYCRGCENRVYFCESDEETLSNARQGRCIARREPHSSELGEIVIGRPEIPHEPTPDEVRTTQWMHREQDIARALEELPGGPECCTECCYPIMRWWKACRVCRARNSHRP